MGSADFFARLLWGSGFVFFACCHLFVWVVRKYIFCEIYDTRRGNRREQGKRESAEKERRQRKKSRKNMRYVDEPGRKRKAATIFFYAAAFRVLFCSGPVWLGFFLGEGEGRLSNLVTLFSLSPCPTLNSTFSPFSTLLSPFAFGLWSVESVSFKRLSQPHFK